MQVNKILFTSKNKTNNEQQYKKTYAGRIALPVASTLIGVYATKQLLKTPRDQFRAFCHRKENWNKTDLVI